DYRVVSQVAEVAHHPFDQVWLGISSAGLRGPWLEALLRAAPNAQLVAALPSESDRQYMLRFVAEERLIQCMVTFLAYTSPLPGETRAEPGMAFWFPPLLSCAFWGSDPATARAAASLLKRGGCPASYQKHLLRDASFSSALLMPLLGALEG